MTASMHVAIPVFPRFTALDAVGPYEVLQRIPTLDVTFVGHERGQVRTENGMLGVSVDATFEELPAPDVIVFPGGVGSRPLQGDERVLAWLREAHRGTRFTTSVCTGSLVLGAAGLLDGLSATTHWACYERAGRARRPADARAGGRAPRPPDHHRRGGLERHRHGAAPGGAADRRHSRPGGAAHDRVRPPAAVRLGLGRQVRRCRDEPGRGVRSRAVVALAQRSALSRSSRRSLPSSPTAAATYHVVRGRDVHVLLNVGRLVGQTALASRPADLPRLPRRAEWTARRPTAAHDGNLADHRVRADFQGRAIWLARSPGSSVRASRRRSTTTPMPLRTGIGTSRSTLPELQATNFRVTVPSTSTVRTPTGWPRSGEQAGIDVDGPRDEDYGKREGSITDPDGNVIRFGSPIR